MYLNFYSVGVIEKYLVHLKEYMDSDKKDISFSIPSDLQKKYPTLKKSLDQVAAGVKFSKQYKVENEEYEYFLYAFLNECIWF